MTTHDTEPTDQSDEDMKTMEAIHEAFYTMLAHTINATIKEMAAFGNIKGQHVNAGLTKALVHLTAERIVASTDASDEAACSFLQYELDHARRAAAEEDKKEDLT